jgi:rRNA small subunit pseudouridine methyltransferase Nep1
MLNLIVAEAALELIPKEILKHPSVKSSARLFGLKPSSLLLDRSYHHSAMLRLENTEKRGRPDIVHFALLEATSTPLYKENMLKVYIHTINNKVIEIGEGVRLPRTYFRFHNLISQLFKKKEIDDSVGKMLLKYYDSNFKDLLDKIKPTLIVGFSRLGEFVRLDELCISLAKEANPVAVIGGFQRGHFSKQVSKYFDKLVSIYNGPLDTHVVIARLIYEFEKVRSLANL